MEDERDDSNSPLDDLPPCAYGDKCYRKNPEHFLLYSHPPTLARADTWPPATPSSAPPPSQPQVFSSPPLTSTPFINLAGDDDTPQTQSKKRKIEPNGKGKLHLHKR